MKKKKVVRPVAKANARKGSRRRGGSREDTDLARIFRLSSSCIGRVLSPPKATRTSEKKKTVTSYSGPRLYDGSVPRVGWDD
jgi:hypothetical protein